MHSNLLGLFIHIRCIIPISLFNLIIYLLSIIPIYLLAFIIPIFHIVNYSFFLFSLLSFQIQYLSSILYLFSISFYYLSLIYPYLSYQRSSIYLVSIKYLSIQSLVIYLYFLSIYLELLNQTRLAYWQDRIYRSLRQPWPEVTTSWSHKLAKGILSFNFLSMFYSIFKIDISSNLRSDYGFTYGLQSFVIRSFVFCKLQAKLLQPIIAINHFKMIGINLIGILNHVKRVEFFLSLNVYFKTFTQLT